MRITLGKSLTFLCGSLCLISTASAGPLRAVDYREDGRVYEDRRVEYRHGRREVLPARVRIEAVTRHDRELARMYTDQLYAEGPIDPHGPSVNIKISYGKIRLNGRIENTGEHTQFVDAARRLRGAGVVDIQDELRTGVPSRY